MPSEVEDAPGRADLSFVGLHRAFPGPQMKHGRGLRPLSLPVIVIRGHKERIIMKTLDGFKSEYKVCMPLSGIATSWFEHNKNKFAYLDYDVKKGFK